uniref:ribosome maturation factor RimM n=1 Tax=Agathobacter sp. TaxID=2021311 RepID=UPI00405658BA
MEQFLRVGVITSTHGVRGEVKVYPTTDDPQRFKKLKQVILDDGKQTRELEIMSVKFHKNMVILKFKGIDNINDVEKYKQADLLITRENAVKLEEGEYFIVDLIGLKGTTDEGEEIGMLSDVIQTGANDVYVFSKEGVKDLLVPKIPDCVKEINLEEGTVLVHLLPGLRD